MEVTIQDLKKKFPLTIKWYAEEKGAYSFATDLDGYVKFIFKDKKPHHLAIFELEGCEEKLKNPDPIVRKAREGLPGLTDVKGDYHIVIIRNSDWEPFTQRTYAYQVEFRKHYVDGEPIVWEYLKTRKD